MIQENLKQVYSNSRVLFVLRGCPICHIWKQFIEMENMRIKAGKRILVVDGSLLAEHGIYDNLFLRVFDKFIQDPPGSGSYFFPALFIDGNLITGANSREEALNFVRGLLHDDYTEPYENFEFTKECEFVWRKGKKIMLCGGVEL